MSIYLNHLARQPRATTNVQKQGLVSGQVQQLQGPQRHLRLDGSDTGVERVFSGLLLVVKDVGRRLVLWP